MLDHVVRLDDVAGGHPERPVGLAVENSEVGTMLLSDSPQFGRRPPAQHEGVSQLAAVSTKLGKESSFRRTIPRLGGRELPAASNRSPAAVRWEVHKTLF